MITYEEIRKNEDIRTYIQSADEALAALGFTEHSFAHVTKVAESVKYILETLGFSAHAVELERKPLSGVMMSSGPPHMVPMAGKPVAIASMNTMPNVSAKEASTKASQVPSNPDNSSRDRRPVSFTCSCRWRD